MLPGYALFLCVVLCCVVHLCLCWILFCSLLGGGGGGSYYSHIHTVCTAAWITGEDPEEPSLFPQIKIHTHLSSQRIFVDVVLFIFISFSTDTIVLQ